MRVTDASTVAKRSGETFGGWADVGLRTLRTATPPDPLAAFGKSICPNRRSRTAIYDFSTVEKRRDLRRLGGVGGLWLVVNCWLGRVPLIMEPPMVGRRGIPGNWGVARGLVGSV